jgi:hypothetical protein
MMTGGLESLGKHVQDKHVVVGAEDTKRMRRFDHRARRCD